MTLYARTLLLTVGNQSLETVFLYTLGGECFADEAAGGQRIETLFQPYCKFKGQMNSYIHSDKWLLLLVCSHGFMLTTNCHSPLAFVARITPL